MYLLLTFISLFLISQISARLILKQRKYVKISLKSFTKQKKNYRIAETNINNFIVSFAIIIASNGSIYFSDKYERRDVSFLNFEMLNY